MPGIFYYTICGSKGCSCKVTPNNLRKMFIYLTFIDPLTLNVPQIVITLLWKRKKYEVPASSRKVRAYSFKVFE